MRQTSASVVTKIITNLVRMCFPTPFVKFLVGTALGFFTNIFASLRINAVVDSSSAMAQPLKRLDSDRCLSVYTSDDDKTDALTVEAWSSDDDHSEDDSH